MDFRTQAIRYLKNELSAEERQAFEEELTNSLERREELEQSRELLDLLEAANEAANIRLVNAQIQEAIRRGASDIHIVPDAKGSVVSLRIDGRLHEFIRQPLKLHQPIVDRWKQITECNPAERKIPQQGQALLRSEGSNYVFHVSFLPTIAGERITARLVDRSQKTLGLDSLGLSPAQVASLQRLTDRPYGFLITAGQVDTGKTTLLYSLLNRLNAKEARRRNILTVEDPVEYQIRGISQVAVNRASGLTYAATLRAFLRSDPDVLYISELRSLEVTELATELALVRALVLTQLHVSSALLIPQRLREIGIVPHLIAQTLAGAIGQRLVRKVCPECAVEYEPALEALEKAGLSLLEDGPFRHGVGCEACMQTGFKGRVGLFEVLEVDEPVRTLIAEGASVEQLWQATFGRTGGSLWDDARAKVRQGLTTVEEVAWALFDYPLFLSAQEPGLRYTISDLMDERSNG